MEWPDWWDWELWISPHCAKRMVDRGFNETDLRAMLADTTAIDEQVHGTFVIETIHEGAPWELIVSPDRRKQVIVVVTAYPL